MPPASGRAQRKRGRARTRKDEVIEIRVTREVKALLNQAAKLAGQKLADFVLASARRQAEEMLVDPRSFILDSIAQAKFGAMVNSPLAPMRELLTRMRRRPPWER